MRLEANMLRTILVPLDGSALGEHALPVAARLARGTGATLHVVRVHVPHTRAPLSLEGMPVTDPDMDSLRWEAERAYVTRMRERLGARSELDTRIAVLNGQVAEVLATYAAFNQVDLIVMSTHGREGMARAWLGSVADELLRRSCVPVLLVRPEQDAQAVATLEGAPRIVIALDGSRLAEQVLDHAVSLGRPLGAEYTLLRVVNPLGSMGDLPAVFAPRLGRAVAAQHVAEAKAYLAGIARGMKARGLEARVKVVESERAADAILDEAARHGTGFVAMATHGRSGLTRLILGSVASRVLHETAVPLLLYRPSADRRGLKAVPAEVAAAT
jgi:nucleotide-binding universal stress UspA family protein